MGKRPLFVATRNGKEKYMSEEKTKVEFTEGLELDMGIEPTAEEIAAAEQEEKQEV